MTALAVLLSWAIKVSGDGLKGGKEADLILTKRTHDLCLKYQDVKEEVVGEVSWYPK